ncbi:hypothetical protein BESB_082570 [Besnoitia besnoiti]|uniref:N-acetylgalactosaminide beta-1,3-galactosyltransferase n=1 Tax=Besnoitia besnoiti TaxID=94643 RepID=A0A2A9M3J5_BESBE|nr:hypothetical protein BESB_082570 [Besnoitia besnoiti]PFH33058.1 hypothetical protein BESB_082570 [Besnoitia besnoiti]
MAPVEFSSRGASWLSRFLWLVLALPCTPSLDGKCEVADGDLPKPATLQRVMDPLPFLQSKTLFLIANEPVLESHVVSNLLHNLLYTLQVPNGHVQLLDEILLSEHGKSSYAALLPWLRSVHQALPPEIEFIWLGTAYSRIVGPSLEKLMTLLADEAKASGEAAPTSSQWYPHGLCIGFGLRDQVLSIAHHFYHDEAFLYPFLDAGLLMDRRFLTFLDQTIEEEGKKLSARIEIDPLHELFKFLYETRGFLVQHSPLFCPASPIPRDFDRAEDIYPPPHQRLRPSEQGLRGNDEEQDAGGAHKQGTAKGMAGSRRSPVVSRAEKNEIEGCVSFAVGCRHSPILSHQFFDRLLAFEQDLLDRKEALVEQYPIDADADENSELRAKEEVLLKERPVFIAEPEDVLIAVKTHPKNHTTRVPLLKKLWAAPDVVLEMAQRRAKAGRHSHPFEAAVAEREHASLEQHMRNIAIEFYSEEAEDSSAAASPADMVTVQVSSPGEKRALCEKLRAILKHFYERHPTRRFLVIVDDDTLVNVRHLLDAISMTLHPPVPARAYFREALSDQNGIRRAHAPYRALASDIEAFLSDWEARHAVEESRADASSGQEGSAGGPQTGKSDSEKKSETSRNDSPAPPSLSFISKAYVKGHAAGEAGSGGGQKSLSRVVDRVSPLYLGQRYSFGHTDSGHSGGRGYDYITMGGGVVLDREAVQAILECETCQCPSEGAADDMILGLWMHQLKIPALHSRWFHQERPADYHPEHVRATTPVSFHRMEKEEAATKKLFDKFVDIGDGMNLGAEDLDDFDAVDWIDLDWQQIEDVLWSDHDGGDDLDDENDDELSLHSIVKRVVEEGKRQGKQNMSPADIADHIEKEVKEDEERRNGDDEDWSWLHDEL